MKPPLIRPPALKEGATLGVFTPSFPANVAFRPKYLHGLEVLKGLGFQVTEGELTAAARSEGYRSGTPRERAAELMALFRDPRVQGIVATIGGSNSSSLIPYLDFDEIRAHPKVLCGYSDVTSLHLALLAYAGLRTFYGPAVMPSFGEWPAVLPETRESFLDAVQRHVSGRRELRPPPRWSNHFRDARTDAWKTEPRRFEPNPGWQVLNPGTARAPVIVANLNTLVSAAGTGYFPDLEGCVLLIEEMDAPLSREERSLRQLERMGVFDAIAGLIVGKPEKYDSEGAPFGLDELLLEIVGADRRYPIVSQFDCGHTYPMLTLAERCTITLEAERGSQARVVIEEPMVVA